MHEIKNNGPQVCEAEIYWKLRVVEAVGSIEELEGSIASVW